MDYGIFWTDLLCSYSGTRIPSSFVILSIVIENSACRLRNRFFYQYIFFFIHNRGIFLSESLKLVFKIFVLLFLQESYNISIDHAIFRRYVPVKEVFSVLMLCAPVFIFYLRQLSSFRAPTLWFTHLKVATCHIQYTFSEFMPICLTRKRTKHENTRSPPFSCDTKMAADGY